jgi:hypothetical protein
MDREELLRVSVGSLADWEHVKNDLHSTALAFANDTLDSEHLPPSERAAVLADFDHVGPAFPPALLLSPRHSPSSWMLLFQRPNLISESMATVSKI